MTELSFHYHLSIDFDSPVHDHCFALRCCPQTDERQQIEKLQFDISPREDLWFASDNFGNRYAAGSIRKPHEHFEVNVSGLAFTGRSFSTVQTDEYRENIYKYQTALTKPDRAVFDTVINELQPDDGNPLLTADRIMDYLADHMTYVPGVTWVNTTAAEAFALKQGVCQDYSHIMLSMLRSRGICARYVVGLLLGEGMSHAWVEVRSEGRWYGFDPTNHVRVSDQHIKLSHGRDYRDCMINIGCMSGRAMQTQTVRAAVQKVIKQEI